MPVHRIGVLAALLSAGTMLSAAAQTIETVTVNDAKLVHGPVAFAGGRTLQITHGIGSAAFRRADAPANRFVTVGDRGPNFTCGDAQDVIGVDGKTFCGETKQARIYGWPGYSPSIYRIEVGADGVKVLDIIPLKDASGRPVSGMPNKLTHASTENPLGPDRQSLAQSAGAVDAEGIVELADGTFWIGEENATSILHVAADGRILRRIVPAGTEGDFAEAGYPVDGGLPALLAKRQANRGIESMALSADEKTLWFVLQNPLANPDAKAFDQARNTRLFAFDLAAGRLVHEYVYELTEMARFPGEETKKPSTARISELLALPNGRFLLDDRTDRTTLIFEIDPAGATDILGGKWDDPATMPSLEQVQLADAGIVPVAKSLVLDSSRHPELPTKIEGLALFGDGSLMLINDNDFGIAGADTVVVKVKGLPALD